jgi:hypothetical protein
VITELVLDGKTSTDIGGLGIGRFRPRGGMSARPTQDPHPDKKGETDAED